MTARVHLLKIGSSTPGKWQMGRAVCGALLGRYARWVRWDKRGAVSCPRCLAAERKRRRAEP